MGIKDLHKFLKDRCGDVYVEKHLSEYAYKKIAIDISTYIYKYKNVFREHWLNAILKLLTCLRKNKIHPVVVFDSKGPIEEKKAEFERRQQERSKQKERISILRNAIEKYQTIKECDEILKQIGSTSILRPEEIKVDNKAAKAKLSKMEKNDIKISDEDISNFQKLLSLMNVPYIVEKAEAEKVCAYLCIKGEVDGVLSEDTDVIAYGTPKFIYNLNTSSQTITEIAFTNITDSLEISHSKFLDFCILCGTDYNKRIKNVGPTKAYNLLELKKMEDIEQIEFDYQHIREMFTKFEEFSEMKMPDYCSTPDWERLSEFLFRNNIRYDISLIRNAIEPCMEFLENSTSVKYEESDDENADEDDDVLAFNKEEVLEYNSDN